MAWVQISEEEAKNHPYWDKFCWVRWLFIIMGMLKAGFISTYHYTYLNGYETLQ